MTEAEKPQISTESQPENPQTIPYDEIPGRNDEEKIAWLRAYKAHASKPRKKWTPDDLTFRFPKGRWNNNVFSDRKDNVERFFNSDGYEIERRTYSGNKTFPIHERQISEHDTDGYLTESIHISNRGSYLRRFEYTVREDGMKELTRSITYDYTRDISSMELWKPTGTTYMIDFSDIPLDDTQDTGRDEFAI